MGIAENVNIYDVVFLIDSNPSIGTNYDQFKTSYIIPALEFFNGGQLDNYEFGFSSNSCLYCQATYHGLSNIPAVTSSELYTNPSQLIDSIDQIQFSGFFNEHARLCDLLVVGLQIFMDISKLRQNRVETSKHCILICDSISSSLSTNPNHPTHPNLTSEEILVSMVADRINISIFCPRKIPVFNCLSDLMIHNGDKNFAVDNKHLIIVNGFNLPEIPLTNNVIKAEELDSKIGLARHLASASISKQSHQLNDNMAISTKDTTSNVASTRLITSFNPLGAVAATRRQIPMATINPISITDDAQKNPITSMQNISQQNNMPQNIGQQNNQLMGLQNMGHQNLGQSNVSQNMGQTNMNQGMGQNINLQNMGQSNMGQQNMGMQNIGQMNMALSNMGQQNAMTQQNLSQQLMGQQNLGVNQQQMETNMLPSSQNVNTLGQHRAIWNGLLEWQEKSKQPTNIAQRNLYSIRCQLTIPSNEPDIPTSQWPDKLSMTLIPHSVLQPLSALFKNSRSLIFLFSSQLSDKDTLDNLSRMLANGFGGCIYIHPTTAESNNDVKVLVLLYSSKKQQYLGLIPQDQVKFLTGIRNVINKHKIAGAKLMNSEGNDLNMASGMAPVQMMNQMPMSSMHTDEQDRRNMQFNQHQQQMGAEQRQLIAMQQLQQQQQQRMQIQHQMQQQQSANQPLRHLLMSNQQPVRSHQHMLMRSMGSNNAQMFSSMPQQHLTNQQQFLNDDMHMDLP